MTVGIVLPNQKKDPIKGILPMAATAVGSLFGPVGGAVGGVAGKALAGDGAPPVQPIGGDARREGLAQKQDELNAGPILKSGIEQAQMDAPDLVPVLQQALAEQERRQSFESDRRLKQQRTGGF